MISFTNSSWLLKKLYFLNDIPSSDNLTVAASELQGLEQGVDNTTQRISLATNALADLRLQAEELKNQAGDLKEKATKLQEANVEGMCVCGHIWIFGFISYMGSGS